MSHGSVVCAENAAVITCWEIFTDLIRQNTPKRKQTALLLRTVNCLKNCRHPAESRVPVRTHTWNGSRVLMKMIWKIVI